MYLLCSVGVCVETGGVNIMKLGDKEVEYNPDFRFYITTRLSNPHYTPEISTKTLIVNFAVKLQGQHTLTLQHGLGKGREGGFIAVTLSILILCFYLCYLEKKKNGFFFSRQVGVCLLI